MKRKREPTTPGDMLRYEFLEPLGLTQSEFARHIGVEVKAVNRLVNGKTSVTPYMAILLGGALKTSPELWLNLQAKCDLYEALSSDVKPPPPLAKIA